MAAECLFLVIMVMWLTATCTSCPTTCQCTPWTKKITCKGLSSMDNVLPDIPADTTILEITEATFSSLNEHYFSALPGLRDLGITKGQLKKIGDNAFSNLIYLRILKLNNNQINSLSNKAFSGLMALQTLKLSGNQFNHIASVELFKPLLNLIELDLSYNNMNGIPNGLFSTLPRLQKLVIEGNNIGNLQGDSFQGAQSLTQLMASNCNIQTIETDFFSQISMINTLDLSYNQISLLSPSGNINLRNLRNLTLQGNKLTTLSDGQFQGLNLDSLDISGNDIHTASPNTFMYLGSIRYLDMSRNKLSVLPEYLFQPISSHVYSLKLNENLGLSTLPPKLFAGMQTMQDLNLSSCALEFLSEDHFRSIFSLRQIDISNNLLKSLPLTFMQLATNYMSYIKLDNNRWHCDCNIKPFRDWLMHPRTSSIIYCTDNTPQGFNNNCAKPKCSTPSNLIFRDITMLDNKDVAVCESTGGSTAPPPISVIVGVVVALVVVVIIIAVCICCIYRRHKRGEPLLCGEDNFDKRSREPEELMEKKHRTAPKEKQRREPKEKKERRREPKGKKEHYYEEKKEKRNIDPDIGSLNESDKSFVVRNYFHFMVPNADAVSQQTTSMTRKYSAESLSHSGYGYGSRHGSRHSSQYSLNAGYKIESAVQCFIQQTN